MLESADLAAEIERSSKASPLAEADAREILRSVSRVVVCRGRKTTEIPAGDASPKDLTGPTGSIRAPLVVADDTLLVGFNQEALEELLA